MAPTQLDIMNMALGYIGTRTIQQSEITASPPSSPEAAQCLLYWDRARRSVLRDFPYDFAIRRSALSSTTVPSVFASWSNAYTVPAKMLKALSVHAGSGVGREPFVVEYTSDTTSVLLTNAANAQCVYVVDVEDLTLWDERFVSSMALKLATLISTALLKNNPEKIKELVALYQATIPADAWGEGGWAVDDQNSRLGVMNMALGLVGARMVTAVSENCDEAVQCNLYWDRARRSVLRDSPYRFAVRRAALVSHTMPIVYGGEWTHCYAAPADMLKVLSIHSAPDKQTRQPFTIEYVDGSPVILCRLSAAQCTYTADVTDPAKWDEKFTSAMSAKLALLICGALLKGEKDQGLNKTKELTELYAASIPKDLGWEEWGWSSSGEQERLNICNIALGYAGANMITSLTENVPESVQCSLHWDRARRSVLRDYPFPFAVRRVRLSETTMPSPHNGEWKYSFVAPADMLRAMSVFDGTDAEARRPFFIEYSGSRTAILCNYPHPEMVYVADIEDVSRWDEQFVSAFARKLAFLIGPALLKGEEWQKRAKEMSDLYQSTLPGPPFRDEQWSVESDPTRLGIYNMALGYLDARPIASLAENTSEAVQCGLFWDRARRAALRDFAYRFAQRRVALKKMEVPKLYRRQFRFCYRKPEEALKIGDVHNGIDRVARFPFTMESLPDGEIILCDIPCAQATITVDIPEVEKWEEMFITAMSMKLGILIAPALLGKEGSGKLQHLMNLYAAHIAACEGDSANEGTERHDPDTWLLARGWWPGGPSFCRPFYIPCDREEGDNKMSNCCCLVNVNDYGAVGDGVTDDTRAIQKAVDENPNKKIIFPGEAYVLSDTIRLYGNQKGQEFDLCGSQLLWSPTGPTDRPMLEVVPGDNTGYESFCHIHSGTINGNFRASVGVKLDAYHSQLTNMKVVNCVNEHVAIGHQVDAGTGGGRSLQCFVSHVLILLGSSCPYGWAEANNTVGLAVYEPDNMVDGLNVNRCNKSLKLRAGGNVFVNCHLTAQCKSEQQTIPDTYAIYFDPYSATSIFNTSITNCYFDGPKYVLYSTKNNRQRFSLTNCFYLNLGTKIAYDESNPVPYQAYMLGGHMTELQNDNFTVIPAGHGLCQFFDGSLSVAVAYQSESLIQERYNKTIYSLNKAARLPYLGAYHVTGEDKVVVFRSGNSISSGDYQCIGCLALPSATVANNLDRFTSATIKVVNRAYGSIVITLWKSGSGSSGWQARTVNMVRNASVYKVAIGNPQEVTVNGNTVTILPIYLHALADFTNTVIYASIETDGYVNGYLVGDVLLDWPTTSGILMELDNVVDRGSGSTYATLAQLGCSVSSTLAEVCAAMPLGTTANFQLSGSGTLFNSLPGDESSDMKFLKLYKGSAGGVSAMLTELGGDAVTMFSTVVSSEGDVYDWKEL